MESGLAEDQIARREEAFTRAAIWRQP